MQGFGRGRYEFSAGADLSHLKAFPVSDPSGKPFGERGRRRGNDRADQRAKDMLGAPLSTVVDLEGKAEAKFREGRAMHTLRATLDEDGRTDAA